MIFERPDPPVVSSDVIGRYARWGFAYGGVVDRGPDEPMLHVNRTEDLAKELGRFEQSFARFGPPVPVSPNAARHRRRAAD